MNNPNPIFKELLKYLRKYFIIDSNKTQNLLKWDDPIYKIIIDICLDLIPNHITQKSEEQEKILKDINHDNKKEVNLDNFYKYFSSKESVELLNKTFKQIIKEFKDSDKLIGECLDKLKMNHHKRKFARNVLVILFKFKEYLGDSENRKIGNKFFEDEEDTKKKKKRKIKNPKEGTEVLTEEDLKIKEYLDNKWPKV